LLRAPATISIWSRRSPVSGDLLLSLAALSIPARSPFSVIFNCSPSGSSRIVSINPRSDGGSQAAVLVFQGLAEPADFLAVDVRHSGVQQFGHFRCLELQLELPLRRSSTSSSFLIDVADTPSLIACTSFPISRSTILSSCRPWEILARCSIRR